MNRILPESRQARRIFDASTLEHLSKIVLIRLARKNVLSVWPKFCQNRLTPSQEGVMAGDFGFRIRTRFEFWEIPSLPHDALTVYTLGIVLAVCYSAEPKTTYFIGIILRLSTRIQGT